MAKVILKWEDSNRIEAGYKIYRTDIAGVDPATLTPYATLPADSTEFVDTDVAYGETWYYTISAYDDNDEVFGKTIDVRVGKVLITSARNDRTVRYISPETGEELATIVDLNGDGTDVMGIDYDTRTGNLLSMAGYRQNNGTDVDYEKTLNIYVSNGLGEHIKTLTTSGNVRDICLDGELVHVSSDNNSITTIDIVTGEVQRDIPMTDGGNIQVFGDFLVAVQISRTTNSYYVFSVTSGELLNTISSNNRSHFGYNSSSYARFTRLNEREIAAAFGRGIFVIDLISGTFKTYGKQWISGGIRNSTHYSGVMVGGHDDYVYYADLLGSSANTSIDVSHIVKGKINRDTGVVDIVWAKELPFGPNNHRTNDMVYDHEEDRLYTHQNLNLMALDGTTGDILWVNASHIGGFQISGITLTPGKSYYYDRKTLL